MPAGPWARVERTLPGPKDRLLLLLPQLGAHSVAWTMGTATWGGFEKHSLGLGPPDCCPLLLSLSPDGVDTLQGMSPEGGRRLTMNARKMLSLRGQ